jgi:hypothetical protein
MLSLKELKWCAIAGFIGALMLFAAVVATGQTFGQRAALKYPRGSQEWKQEVHRLSQKS